MQKAIVILLLSVLSITVEAQFSVGYRYGIGNHSVYLEPYSPKFITSYTRSSHGLIFTYNNMMNAGLQVEVNYAQKGWKEVIDSIPNTFFARDLDYIEIPIYAHFELGHYMIRPVIIAGPYIAFQVNDSKASNGFDDRINSPNFPHYLLETQKVDFGIKLGGGLRLNIVDRFAIFGEVHYDVDMAGGRDIFINRPEGIQASRLTEISGVFGILWHFIPQKEKPKVDSYKPKENLYDFEY